MTVPTNSNTGRSRFGGRSSAVLLVAGFVIGAAAAAFAFWTVNVFFAPTNYALARADSLSAPTTPTATVGGSGTITVGWTLPGTQLAGAQYQVTRTSGPGSPTTVCTVASIVTSCQETNLTGGTTYGYSIMATLASWQSTGIMTSATTATPTFSIVLSASPYTAGSPITVQTIQAKIGASVDTTYAGSKTINWSGLANSPSGQVPSYPASSVTFTNGVASPGSAFTAYASGSNTLTATDANATSVTGSATFTVVPATAASLSLAVATTTPSAGVADNLSITALDAFGNTATGYTGSKSLIFGGASTIGTTHPTVTSSAGAATSFGTSTPVTFSGGVSTVSGPNNGVMTLYKAETVSITVSDGFINNGAGRSVTVSAAAANTIATVSGSAQTAAVSTAFTNPLIALVADQYANPVPGVSVTFAGPSSGASGTFATCTSNPQPYSCVALTAANGRATSSTFRANSTVGSYNVAASASGAGSVNFALTNAAGSATKLAFASQPALGASIQATGTGSFSAAVAVQDANGNVVTSDNATTVTLAIGTNPSSGVLSCTSLGGVGPVSVTSGVASFTGCSITKVGTSYTLTATSSPPRTAPANANAFNITPGTSTKLVFTGQPTTAMATTTITPVVQVSVEDVNGNVETGDSATNVTVAIGTNPGGGTLSGTVTNTVTSGVASFNNISINKTGTGYTLAATSSPANGTTTSSAFDITSGPLASFTVTSPGTQTAGTAFSVTVTALDAGANPAAGWTSGTGCVIFSGPANSPNGTAPTYPAPGSCSAGQSALSFNGSAQATASITLFRATASTTILTVKDAATQTRSGSTVNFAVNSKGVALAFSPGPTATVPKGSSQVFTITVPNDQYGNPFSSSSGVAVNVTLTPATGNWGFTAATSSTSSTTTVTISSGPATNTFSVFTDNAANKTATLSATTSAAGFISPGNDALTST